MQEIFVSNIIKESQNEMTYQQLLNKLQKATPEQLSNDVSVCFRATDEFYPVSKLVVNEESDVLDIGHLYLFVK
jgi:hypothetical protein